MTFTIFNKSYDKYSTKLNLCFQRLNRLPEDVERLENLKELDMSYNNFKVYLPIKVCHFFRLTKLLLYFNQFTDLPPEIGQLKELTELNLYGNQLTSLPAEIGQLVNLKILLVPHNRLIGLPSEIGQLVNLEIFHVHTNQLTALPAEIGHLLLIKELLVHANQLTRLPLELGQLMFIENISVYNNPLENLLNPIIQRLLSRQKQQKTIYEDAQNIHNSSIQNSTKESIYKLLNNYTADIITSEYLEWEELSTEIKQRITEYIVCSDVHSILNVTFADVFYAVVTEIKTLPDAYHSAIKQRINEEMQESECKCFSGRLTRLVNSLSGFSDKVAVTLSESEEISNLISVVLRKFMNESTTVVKDQIKKELHERGYTESLINEWLVYIDI
jgi:hypothetical protein